MNRLFLHWKSTVQPILTGGLVLMPMLIADGGPWAGNKRAAWYVGAGIALAKFYIGILQKDAGTELVQTPEGVKPVDSHELPTDDPTLKVVK